MFQLKYYGLVAVGVLILAIYPTLFATIYESGKDFGRNLARALLS
ncbi:bacteriocin [uncultured Enterococcus sp.]|nr:bacteriocin [uncultured Enterococcus sp.]